jgi:hypothetical protein
MDAELEGLPALPAFTAGIQRDIRAALVQGYGEQIAITDAMLLEGKR